MTIGSTIAIDFDNFFRHIDQLKQVFTETKECLDEVDYEEHFDPELYKAAALQENEETILQLCFAKSPCFVILGQSSVSKAAVVNELLGLSLLPTTIEENLIRHSFEDENDRWRQIFIHHGSTIECSLVSITENVNQETKISFDRDNIESGIPRHYLKEDSDFDAVVDIQINNGLLEKSCLVVPAYDSVQKLTDTFLEWSRKSVVVPVYVVNNLILNEKDVDHLTALRRAVPKIPVFFIKSRSYVRYDLPESDRYGFASVANLTFDGVTPPSPYSRQFENHNSPRLNEQKQQFICYGSPTGSESDSLSFSNSSQTTTTIRQQLVEIGFISSSSEKFASTARKSSKKLNYDEIFKSATDLKCDLIESGHDLPKLVWFVRQILRSHLLRLASRINMWHDNLMNLFILTAFDMARDQIITPKRIVYARNKCLELYSSLMKSTLQKQQEIEKLISTTINELKNEIIDDAGRLCIAQSLDNDVPSTSNVPIEITCESFLTTEDVQRFVLVKLSKEIADRLTNSFLCLKQTYVGTLQRCLDSLENMQIPDEKENVAAGAALKQMLSAAYNVELTWQMCTPLVHLLWDKMKQVGYGAAWLLLPCCPYVVRSSCCDSQRRFFSLTNEDEDDENFQPLPFVFDSDDSFEALSGNRLGGSGSDDDVRWRKKVAADTLVKLSEAKLAKVLCSQFQTRICMAHEGFQSALNKIEEFHTGRLRMAEEQRLMLRKQHAPRLAKLAMESLALRDSLLYGMPKLGLEIGRGQYGVVYQCDNWGCFGACAVKSVVPPDDKHWNDLALEFYYTKSLIEHERVVKLHGAVIDHNYGGGGSLPAVLLIMERMKRDLHSAIRGGLNFGARLRVAIDVIEGLRFLHSQGLVHRDIKLKNVLLDDSNRAKITDLGFCKPEAMMSGSVVGTPIHMAPELFTRNYDSSVDVYAFGVLFWYICAGHVRLPQTFEQCISKDQLWSSVKQGVRPEQLSCFDAECWDIMQACWSGDPNQRPLLGDMQPRLESLLVEYTENMAKSSVNDSANRQ